MDNQAAVGLYEELALTSTRLTGSLNRVLGGVHGISATDLVLMRALSTDAGMRRIDLAEVLGMTASGVSRALRPLEKRGLVQSTRDPHDARASRTLLTEAGQTLLAQAGVTAEEKVQHTLGRLYPDEVAALRRLLAKLRG